MGNRYTVFAFTLAAAWLLPAAGLHAQTPEAGDDTVAAASVSFDIPAGPMAEALTRFSEQSGVQLMYEPQAVSGEQVAGFRGTAAPIEVLQDLIGDTGLTWIQVNANTVALQYPNGAGNTGPRRGIEEIIVTGQKREERIQDVPIAISAFSAEDLEAQKLEGGFDLLKAIPNVSFSKTNFTSYNFQIRGVGTQSISATSDPGVAVSFNNVAIIQNRLFEQEYLDVERVEVLRGPQGTLYGRNATAGVINVISNKPELGVWSGMLDVEVGNYNTRRLRGHFNMPVGDTFAIRGAYASTQRDGYGINEACNDPLADVKCDVDNRDLWTGRLSLGWQPMDSLRVDLIWERFEEDDRRVRTSKQLCHRDPGPEVLGETVVGDDGTGTEVSAKLRPALFSQACQPGSLYADEAFGTPNGLALPLVFATIGFGGDCGESCNAIAPIGTDDEGRSQALLQIKDPYDGQRQSRNLRTIDSIREPRYRATADLVELNIDFDLTESLVLSSQTAYVDDETYSFQDFNRFNTVPVFQDTSEFGPANGVPVFRGDYTDFAPGGVFCDPQIGCSNKLAGFDIAQASAEQFSQELRVQSSFSGPLNFSLGVNYTEFDVLVDYYVMYNLATALALMPPLYIPGFPANTNPPDPTTCGNSGFLFSGGRVPAGDPEAMCPFVDMNPLDTSKNFEGDGHNYFRSKNPYELESWAGFGELYWNIRDDLKLTAGLRYTNDKKVFEQVPTQFLLAPGALSAGYASRGHPTAGTISQEWGEWTGRLVLDWQPVLDFTDETLVYASYSRGYKGGGANPPKPGFATAEDYVEHGLLTEDEVEGFSSFIPVLELTQKEVGETFEPEFVNAYEIGTKNTLFGGAMTLNATAFYYDYSDYQVSQIRERTANNENFDTEMWGLELETVFVPSPNWQFLANVGYLKTRIAEGETSIDIMNRTQGNSDYIVAKPWLQLPSNCVIPTDVAERYLQDRTFVANYWELCGGVKGFLSIFTPQLPIDPNVGDGTQPYDVSNYPELNGGAGLSADLGGNELPQSPNLTATLGGQYSFDLTPEWRGTIRMDYYWQDESYHRVYNLEPYDRLKSWSNTNLSFWVNNANSGITVEAYVKNLFNETPITGAFVNSDDTGLTTNVFTLDPRLIGVSIRKEW